MPSLSDQLRERCLALTWSLWAELGASGWRRSHTSHAIDPEPLILFTAALGDADPRLREESIEWCVTYGRYVSGARLRNLLAAEPAELQEAFGTFAATVNAHSALTWPGATVAREYRPTARSRVPDFGRPSLLGLRLRALFGVGARSEILRVFLAHPPARLSAADLAADVGYTKRNVAESLNALRMAGLLAVSPQRNQLRYRLNRPKELAALASPIPSLFPQWRPLFGTLNRLIDTALTAEGLPPRVRNVEVVRALRDLENKLRVADVTPPPFEGGRDQWTAFETWALDLAGAWAAGKTPGRAEHSAAESG